MRCATLGFEMQRLRRWHFSMQRLGRGSMEPLRGTNPIVRARPQGALRDPGLCDQTPSALARIVAATRAALSREC